MGLVDYDSDSGSSDGEQATSTATAVASKPAAALTTTTTTATGKKPFQKLVDRANPGRIVVSLPTAANEGSKDADPEDERPAKRARVGAGASRFGGFGSLLPTPKKALSKPTGSSSTGVPPSGTASRQNVQLKTSSEAAFSRQRTEATATATTTDSGENNGQTNGPPAAKQMSLPPPKAPSIPGGQKAAEDVKLVGNPLMFMPLSVSRKPGGKKKKPSSVGGASTAHATTPTAKTTAAKPQAAPPPAAAAPPKKISLFSLDTSAEEEAAAAAAAAAAEDADEDATGNGSYQPMFQDTYAAYEEASADYTQQQEQTQQAQQAPKTLDSFADDLNLSARERRELFGRGGSGRAVTAATFNMDQEYRHNEQLRQSGEAEQKQSHNPVRAIMPGKHSLRQLVTAVQSQRDALEETFAKNRASQRESGSRYGWR